MVGVIDNKFSMTHANLRIGINKIHTNNTFIMDTLTQPNHLINKQVLHKTAGHTHLEAALNTTPNTVSPMVPETQWGSRSIWTLEQ